MLIKFQKGEEKMKRVFLVLVLFVFILTSLSCGSHSGTTVVYSHPPVVSGSVTATFDTSKKAIVVSWKPAKYVEKYLVEKSENGGDFSELTYVLPPTTSIEDKDVQDGKYYKYRVDAINADGSSSYVESKRVDVPDVFPPDTFIDSGPPPVTFSTSAVFKFHGEDPNHDESNIAKYECSLDNGQWRICSSPYTVENLEVHYVSHTFQVRAIDQSGNVDPTPAEFTWSIDVESPGAYVINGPLPVTNSTTAVFKFGTFQNESVTFQCDLDDGGWEECSNPVTYSGLSDGSHVLKVRGIDKVGNIDSDPNTYTWTIDTVPPDTQIVEAPPYLSNSTSATFKYGSSFTDVIYFQCKLDSQGWTQCNSRKVTYQGLTNGSHTFQVRAQDQAGNVDSTPAEYNWKVDTEPPILILNSKPSAITTSTTATFSFTVTGASSVIHCGVDKAESDLPVCISPRKFENLSYGSHTFVGISEDDAGNVTKVIYTWNITHTTWRAISSSYYFNCGVTTRGKLFCWGFNNSGIMGPTDMYKFATYPVKISSDISWKTVSSGISHVCAITISGALYCWGNNDMGQLGLGDTSGRFSPVKVSPFSNWHTVSAGSFITCGINVGGNLYCWGNNNSGQIGVGDNTTSYFSIPQQVGSSGEWENVSVESSHVCAIKKDGSLWCWGNNGSGQLGIGSYGGNYASPVQVGSDTDWKAVSVSDGYSCGIKSDGSLYCWGDNSEGELGLQTSGNRYATPQKVNTGSNITWIDVTTNEIWDHEMRNHRQTCAISDTKDLYCWGYNYRYILGNDPIVPGAIPNYPRQVFLNATFKKVSLGNNGCAILDDGSLGCWGWNYYGMLGIQVSPYRESPGHVVTDNMILSVFAGSRSAFAMDDHFDFLVWGDNYYSELGNGDNVSINVPQKVNDPNYSHMKISSNGDHTCGIRNGDLWCWGKNDSGQLGTGDTNDVSYPVKISEGNWTDISAGYNHTCGIDNGKLFCWGGNSMGQLGIGNSTSKNTPVQVGTDANWIDVSAGENFTCGVKGNKTLWCWGDSSFGKIGSTTLHYSPVQVGNDSDWETVTTGRNHACGIKSDKTLLCWGYNGSGQLGAGNSNSYSSTPLQVASSKKWKMVSTGDNHTCAIADDWTLWCWGDNTYGEAGVSKKDYGDSIYQPVHVSPGKVWTSVQAGGDFTCAIDDHYKVYCWGNNNYGQLGIYKDFPFSGEMFIVEPMWDK